ncbi:MAG: peptidoglycan DD-metalloendopeptidase family protein [Alphaproteobacteria bacterium]|nr:peptidoglycan DD-metalloendopeptidase family protein [Alphaproteobacteria bacterium]
MIRFVFFILIFILPLHAMAETASRREKLENLQLKMEEQEQQKKELEQKAQDVEKELGKTKDLLVGIGKDVQSNEKTLRTLEDNIAVLERKKQSLSDSLEKDRVQVARLILALERLRRVPPEALIAKPGAPLETAQSALLLKELVPLVHRQAESLRLKLEELGRLAQDLQAQREKALAAGKELKDKQKELTALLDKRETLYRSTSKGIREHEKALEAISQQASNLRDLMKKIEDGTARTASMNKAPPVDLPNPGNTRLPVAGVITINYGQPDDFGAPSSGLTVEARDKALVVAPMGGVVRFAGAFKNYGQMVIIQHKKGYHSLIAGLKKIDTVVGQSVAAGEPLGQLGSSTDGSKPTLYYELRLNGEPVNPASLFHDLG